MVLEINKKNVAAFAILVLVIIAFTFGGYRFGYGNGYDYGYNYGYKHGFNKGKTETILSYEKRKGNGDIFYSEEIEGRKVNAFQTVGDYIIYHSTPNCEAIKNGVTESRAYTNSAYRSSHSRFCSKCMDEKLIEMCQDWLDSIEE